MQTIAVESIGNTPSSIITDITILAKTLYKNFWQNDYYFTYEEGATPKGYYKITAHTYNEEEDTFSDPIPNVYCYATENVMDAFWELNPHYEQEGFASIIGKENL